MKAAVLKHTGNSGFKSDNFSIENIPVPEISQNEVLIKIHSASLNHRDLFIAQGLYSKIKLPVVLGSDCVGVIDSKGSNVSDFEMGDEVVINPGMNWGVNENFQSKDFKILGMPEDGTFAQFVKINKKYVHKKPSQLTFEEASAIPLAGVTAYRALFKKAEVKINDTVLITGIGGGVATFAMIFAVIAGANVYVTSGSDEKISKAVDLGAKNGVNYRDVDWDKKVLKLAGDNIDVVIDGTGGAGVQKFIEICNHGGRIVNYGATLGNVKELSMHKVYWKQLKLMGTTMGSPQDFQDMINFISNNKIKPVIDEVFVLDEIEKAFQRMKNSEQFGKIILKVK